MVEIPETCPHCDSRLNKWRVPDDASWDDEFFLVCFNNECSYYRRGWEWMMEQYKQKASYRFAVNPNNGGIFMIPVWSEEATRMMIIDEDQNSDERDEGGEG